MNGVKRVVFVLFVLSICFSMSFNPFKSEEGVFVGQQAPDFKLKPIGGGDPISLSKYRGKPVVIVFWAIWCGPCRKELPDLKALYEKYSQKGVVFLTVAVGWRQTEEMISKFQADNKLPYTILWDKDNEVSEKYLVRSIPTNFVIDHDGIIRFRDFALTPQMKDAIDSLVVQK